jgi:mono/diheme cytochrome c family protein
MAGRLTHLRSRAVLAFAVVGAAAFGLAACGGSEPDLANGKAKFAACGGCHTLADAGTTATVGPNLDDAFRGARQDGFKDSTFEGIVRYWIDKPEQKTQPIMPADIVTGKDADDVAAYVAAVAGTDGADSPARPAEEIE